MMTARMGFDDETLMAFADGELDDATADAVAKAINEDEELRERAALFLETRTGVRNAFAATEAVPDALSAAVRGMIERDRETTAATAGVVSLEAHRRAPMHAAPARWPVALAASLASAVTAGLIGYQLGQAPQAETDGTHIARILDGAASGMETDTAEGRLRILASFRDERGALCREYEIDRAGGPFLNVSCHRNNEWETRFAVATPPAGAGYTPASSVEALDAYLESIAAGPPLSPSEEKAALEALR